MDEIINSIINGQRKQAIKQLKDSSFTLEELFEELRLDGRSDEIIVMFRIALKVGYLTENI